MNGRSLFPSSIRLLRDLLVLIFAVVVAVGCDTTGSATTQSASNVAAKDGEVEQSEASPQDSAPSPEQQGDDAKVAAKSESELATRDPGAASLVSFDDLKLGMPVDVKFRPIFLQYNDGKVKEHIGKRIVVAGYMDSTDVMKGVKEFILLRNLECKFGPGGQADHLVRVFMAEDESTSFTDKIVYVEGELSLNPFPADPQAPITWSIYDMLDAKVSTRRPTR